MTLGDVLWGKIYSNLFEYIFEKILFYCKLSKENTGLILKKRCKTGRVSIVINCS